jgi:hypothetical protein
MVGAGNALNRLPLRRRKAPGRSWDWLTHGRRLLRGAPLPGEALDAARLVRRVAQLPEDRLFVAARTCRQADPQAASGPDAGDGCRGRLGPPRSDTSW